MKPALLDAMLNWPKRASSNPPCPNCGRINMVYGGGVYACPEELGGCAWMEIQHPPWPQRNRGGRLMLRAVK